MSGSIRVRRLGGALLAGVTALAVLPVRSARCQEPLVGTPEAVAVAQPGTPAPEPRVVGLPAYPGAREIATLTLNHPGLRERVTALTARLGGGIVITALEAGIYRLAGAVGQEQVLAFYQRELGEERKEQGERATKQGAKTPEGEARVSPLPGGLGYLSITVDPDPLQPRDTRVVVVRVEGSPAARTLLKPLTEIVVAAHLSGIGALPAVPRGAFPPSTGSSAVPITSLMPRLPAFPNSLAESSTRLNSVQVQAIIRGLAVSPQTPAVRQGIAGLLREARSVTLNVYRIPRPVAGSAIVEFYRAAMRTYGGREVASDTADPSRPLLVYKLPADTGVVMIRAYPEQTPLTAYSRVPLPSPISTAISVLRIEGAMLPPMPSP